MSIFFNKADLKKTDVKANLNIDISVQFFREPVVIYSNYMPKLIYMKILNHLYNLCFG